MENEEKNEQQKNSRRDFLKLGAGVGIGALATVTGFNLFAGLPTHEHGEKIEGTVKMLMPDGSLVEVHEGQFKHCEHLNAKEAHQGIEGKYFVMVIDLAKCQNARKCIESCEKAHHLTAEQEWFKVLKMQDSPNTAPYWFPKPCYHCRKPACVAVCPVSASYQRSDGLVLIDSDRCIGCKYCMVACPYSTRHFNWHKSPQPKQIEESEYSPETGLPHKEGTVGKCDFCPDMIRNGKMPHCVMGCPMGVLYFGDANEDAVSNGNETLSFSKLMRDRAGYRFLEHYGTQPNVYYLPPVERTFPFEEMEKTEEKT